MGTLQPCGVDFFVSAQARELIGHRYILVSCRTIRMGLVTFRTIQETRDVSDILHSKT